MQSKRQRRAGSRRISGRHILAAVAAAVLSPATASAQADQLRYFFNGTVGTNGTPIGGYTFDGTGGFYVASFGSSGQIRKVTHDGMAWSGTTLIGNTDWAGKFLKSASLDGNGVILGTNYSSASTIGNLLLNPAALTIGGVTYAPGTVAIVVDQAVVRNTDVTPPSSGAVQPQHSKIVYAYDLRQVGATVASQPASLSTRDRNGDGLVGWNDVFEPIVTAQDMIDVQGGISTPETPSVARRFAFSSDGQSVYVADSAGNFGGIWKVNLTRSGVGALTKVVDSRSGPVLINTEPAVVHTSTRDFGGGAGTGDQIFFRGSTDTGNVGGLNYVVDTGAAVSAPRVAISAKQFAAFFDQAPTSTSVDIRSVTPDASGNLYFQSQGTPAGFYMYDAVGRLVKIASEAEVRLFNAGATPPFNYNASMLDLQTRTVDVTLSNGNVVPMTQVVYDAAVLNGVVGINVYTPGDFNRDGAANSIDANAMKGVLGLRGVNVASNTSNNGNLKYDLNGSSTGTPSAVAIDWKDVKVFQQFAGLSDGDADMDFDVDAADLSALAAHYNGTGKLFTQGNLTSVRVAAADRDDVNYADLVTLAANWTAAKPAPGFVGVVPAADLDRAFAITAGGSITQYQARGSGAWSDAANWSAGVPNAPGAVASLLTKPQDDTTIAVDGTYTVGQLNFDNYFTYTLGGGTIRLQGANGSAAELNAFAASPVINSAVEVNSNASVTVTYTTDAVTVGGPIAIAAGATLTKAGPGTLRLDGGGAGAGTLDVAAGNVVVTDGVTVGGLTVAAGATLDLAASGIVVNTGDPGVASALRAALASGYNAGQWDGLGIHSSAAAADTSDLTALGYLAGPGSFTILRTYYGDANADGRLDADDYALTDRGMATGLTGWSNGDFNYDGAVNQDDYLLLDRGAALTGGNALSAELLATREARFGSDYVTALIASVPEPSLAAFAAAVPLAAGCRRRRRRDR